MGRAPRTAVIISCSQGEAAQTRAWAQRRRQTISGYMLSVVIWRVGVEEQLSMTRVRLGPIAWKYSERSGEPRTTLLSAVQRRKRTRSGRRQNGGMRRSADLLCTHCTFRGNPARRRANFPSDNGSGQTLCDGGLCQDATGEILRREQRSSG